MDIRELYDIFLKHKAISTDSRNIKQDSVFFALKGDTFDGNKYVKESLEKGAEYAVISDAKFYIDEKTILVEDTLKTLQDLAAFHRKNIKTKIIGITGSNGKTTSKELVHKVLSKKHKTFATQGNFNNHIGVPLTLLELTDDIEIAVIEMGANHYGEISELCKIAAPDEGLITNIGKAHIGGFGSVENLIETKLGLFEAVKNTKGYFYLNSNDSILIKKINNYKNIVTYGNAENSIAKVIKIYNDIYLNIDVEINKRLFKIKTNLIGKYNIDNILAAITVGLKNDVEPEKIIEAISEYVPSNNRSQLHKTEKNSLILDMYNANPTSMSLAISNFAEINLPEKVLIIGDMLELGDEEFNEHQEIVNLIKKYNFGKVFLIGKIFSSCNLPAEYKSFANIDDFNNHLKNNQLQSSSILLKASNGTGLKKCVEYL